MKTSQVRGYRSVSALLECSRYVCPSFRHIWPPVEQEYRVSVGRASSFVRNAKQFRFEERHIASTLKSQRQRPDVSGRL
jgi:hypothetical protein